MTYPILGKKTDHIFWDFFFEEYDIRLSTYYHMLSVHSHISRLVPSGGEIGFEVSVAGGRVFPHVMKQDTANAAPACLVISGLDMNHYMI